MKFESISRNKDGNFYVIYSIPSPQKINRKNGKEKRVAYLWL